MDKISVWDIYFATAAGMMLHPGNIKGVDEQWAVERAFDVANHMMKMREEMLCQLGQQEPL